MLLGATGVVVVLTLWELGSRAGWINPIVGSSPTKIVQAGRGLWERGVLLPAIISTAKLFGIGFAISVAIGLTTGIIIGWYQRVNAVVDPWVSLIYAAPRIAFIPLIVVWVGVGLQAQVVLVCLLATFPVIINTATGVGTIDRDHLRLARSLLATNKDVLLTVALPGAVPTILAGIRQGMITALIGVVVAEYFLGNTGVGGLIFTAGLTLQTGQAFVGALIFAIAALVMTSILRTVERRLDRWRT
jgi:NitT/TauT family transport system permease protein